jgi:outer membrane protein assembly factor BamB
MSGRFDARDGHELWRYFWKTRGGTHIGNRGAGLWHNYLFFETPDNQLVSLDARTGKERWNVPIASFAEEYFSTTAPIVVGNHVLVGHRATTSTCPGSCSRSIRKPASCSGRLTPFR